MVLASGSLWADGYHIVAFLTGGSISANLVEILTTFLY